MAAPGTDHIGLSAGAIVCNARGEVFLAQRGAPGTNEHGLWEFPCGGVRFGERLEDAARRAVAEAYGIEIAITRLLHVLDHLPPGEGQRRIVPMFLARHTGGEARILAPGGCAAIGWFAIGALPTPLADSAQESLRAWHGLRGPGPLAGLDHVQLAMPPGGEARARAFYGGLLGLPELPKPPQLAARGGCWFGTPAVHIHLGVEEPFAPARKAHPALLAADAAALRDRLLAAGVAITPDESVPGVLRFYIADPFGNRIEIIQDGQGFRHG